MRPKLFLFLLALMLAAASAWAQTDTSASTVAIGIGGNGIWCSSATPFAADIEGAANASASLSPHLSLVGTGAWGFAHSYGRLTGGFRVTATDVNDRDFSVGLGIQWWVASAEFVNEWKPDVAIGWRPWPARYPKLNLVGTGFYGLTSKQAGATIGARWRVNL